MKRLFMLMLAVFAAVMCLIMFRFGSSLSREGNPVPILMAISRLELTSSEYEQFAYSDERARFVSKHRGESRYDVVKAYMEEKGWEYKEQLGSGLIFEKQKQKQKQNIVIETRQFSKHYVLWDLPAE